MNTDNQYTPKDGEEVKPANNDIAKYGDDTIGENTGDSGLEQDAEKQESYAKNTKAPQQATTDVETVVPDNDN